MKKKLFLGIFVFGMILFALVIKTSSTTTVLGSDNQKENQLNLTLSSTSHKILDLSLTSHEPIEILNDANFTDYGFPGLGTAEEPYLIENYNITTTNKEGIYINDTTKHFVIRKCYVDANENGYGIYISYVTEGTASIINSICSTNHAGIILKSSFDVTLTNNTCNNNWYGIVLRSSSGATLANNTCSNNIFGIGLESSSSSTLMDNTCNNNEYGIDLGSSSGGILTKNTCSNNEDNGISLLNTINSTLDYNTCSDNNDGIFVANSTNAILNNNICNNNNIGIKISSFGATLTNNICSNNKGYGILLAAMIMTVTFTKSENIIIHHNIFIDNYLEGTSQAIDMGINNTWYEEETKEGNHWNDWKSKKPYLIHGSANATDPYPLNKNLERIDFEYTLVIPALILLTILLKIKRKKKSKINY